jgi:hypothetical protein
MRQGLFIALDSASAIGDVRAADADSVVFVHSDAPLRKDWPRYADALMGALTRGVEVVWGVRRGA